MLTLIKPTLLQKGDTIATVSLSWGGAGDREILWRYKLGKQRLLEQFGLTAVEMEHTLKGSDYLYQHPKERAEDLMQAFLNPVIKGIFSCIGGLESIRMLPYIDFDLIRRHPKIFLGYSDSTITHFICLKSGISSFYGPSILAEFAENNKIYDYTADAVRNTLFQNNISVGKINPPAEWTGERIEWLYSNRKMAKKMQPHEGFEFLQGIGIATGPLIGGCMEVLELIKGTDLWPDLDSFDHSILFFETSEDLPSPIYIGCWLRNYAIQGILQKANGIIFGKPCQGKFYQEYKEEILKVVSEFNLFHLPIVCNMPFGHNEPMCILPFGAMAEINCDEKTFSIH